MGGSSLTWKPLAAELVSQMVLRGVNISGYYLFSYVDDITTVIESEVSTALRHDVY